MDKVLAQFGIHTDEPGIIELGLVPTALGSTSYRGNGGGIFRPPRFPGSRAVNPFHHYGMSG